MCTKGYHYLTSQKICLHITHLLVSIREITFFSYTRLFYLVLFTYSFNGLAYYAWIMFQFVVAFLADLTDLPTVSSFTSPCITNLRLEYRVYIRVKRSLPALVWLWENNNSTGKC